MAVLMLGIDWQDVRVGRLRLRTHLTKNYLPSIKVERRREHLGVVMDLTEEEIAHEKLLVALQRWATETLGSGLGVDAVSREHFVMGVTLTDYEGEWGCSLASLQEEFDRLEKAFRKAGLPVPGLCLFFRDGPHGAAGASTFGDATLFVGVGTSEVGFEAPEQGQGQDEEDDDMDLWDFLDMRFATWLSEKFPAVFARRGRPRRAREIGLYASTGEGELYGTYCGVTVASAEIGDCPDPLPSIKLADVVRAHETMSSTLKAMNVPAEPTIMLLRSWD